MHTHVQTTGGAYEVVVIILLLTAFLAYPFAAMVTSRAYKPWPLRRYLFWMTGIACVGLTLSGPLAAFAHLNFVGHMIGHLLLGMLAPLLIALSAPMTLLLRTLDVQTARKVTNLLKSSLFQFLTNPITASVLNIGGLYLLYMTDLYALMYQSIFLYALIHFHVFAAGYLFTVSLIYVDVTSHRYSYIYRSLVLIAALAAHKILAKLIYASPPIGVARGEAEAGAMWMYYGGDGVDLILILILCTHWYKATAPRLLTDDT
ncbi:cytochrome c oxidase assembly protein [Exiguobacterium sp. s7]|uniref:cytochrome c oxidase assembly protein n=1 Tax=Exiguobacterium sp. s7 TaxID=2751235 RepID=UPI001BE62D87|nr:cytochrome c oxidase assembly protein [Exiguobacterium sp. s7]